jgi:uncharacterized protein (DUF1810 family)
MQDSDPFNLQRFVDAQDPVFDNVRFELQSGAKVSHWMWFIFPQVRGLGSSEISKRFAISSRKEASAYLNHPILGQRLKECTHLVVALEGRSSCDIFGSVDDKKFRSCMTLFAEISQGDQIFNQALQKYFDGVPDALTLKLLS